MLSLLFSVPNILDCSENARRRRFLFRVKSLFPVVHHPWQETKQGKFIKGLLLLDANWVYHWDVTSSRKPQRFPGPYVQSARLATPTSISPKVAGQIDLAMQEMGIRKQESVHEKQVADSFEFSSSRCSNAESIRSVSHLAERHVVAVGLEEPSQKEGV